MKWYASYLQGNPSGVIIIYAVIVFNCIRLNEKKSRCDLNDAQTDHEKSHTFRESAHFGLITCTIVFARILCLPTNWLHQVEHLYSITTINISEHKIIDNVRRRRIYRRMCLRCIRPRIHQPFAGNISYYIK